MFPIFETCQEAGLAESIALEKFHVWQELSGETDKFGRYRRTAIAQNSRLLKSYGLASGICVSRFSIVGTSTV